MAVVGCHGGPYVDKFVEAQNLVKGFLDVRFVWIPRERNSEADGLSRRAYEECAGSRDAAKIPPPARAEQGAGNGAQLLGVQAVQDVGPAHRLLPRKA